MSRLDPTTELCGAYVVSADHEFVAVRLAEERARLADPVHLVERVIRPTEFEWDFEPIGPGFLDLAAPYLETPSGAGALFRAMLREFGIERSGARHAVVILEFVHFATRMNDHFNYHDGFAAATPEPALAERLVQLRYGAQWLNNYPRWLLIANELDTTPAALVAMHGWGHHSFTSTGISRAALVRYAHLGFEGVTPDQWLSLAPGFLCESLISPAVMATVLAGCDSNTVATIKRAFSHLAVATKARLERRALGRGYEVPTEAVADFTAPFEFPGVAVAMARPRVDLAPLSDTRFPRVKSVLAALAAAPGVRSDAAVKAVRALEIEHAARFRAELKSSGVLPGAASLAAIFEVE